MGLPAAGPAAQPTTTATTATETALCWTWYLVPVYGTGSAAASCWTVPHHSTPCPRHTHAMPTPCHAMPRHAMHHAMPRHATPCHAMPRHAALAGVQHHHVAILLLHRFVSQYCIQCYYTMYSIPCQIAIPYHIAIPNHFLVAHAAHATGGVRAPFA